MIDVDRLKEALRTSDSWENLRQSRPGGPEALARMRARSGSAIGIHDTLADAARLVVAGQPLWLCQAHDSTGWFDYAENRQSAAQCWVSALDPDAFDQCRMVEGWWFPTGKHET